MILEFFLYIEYRQIKHIRIFTYFDSMASATDSSQIVRLNFVLFLFLFVFFFLSTKKWTTEDRLRRLVNFKD